ncbi:MAG: ABC transporter ATP-binding protein [Labilithrix sp.]|nr:ABC transporter ATP-binding protein [Labilithrix sp.]MCW5809942.1 ABC transporter ATP-binding protein [Labilithrix sp.]
MDAPVIPLDSLLWPMASVRDGLPALAVEARLPIRSAVLPLGEPNAAWLEAACELLGVDAELEEGSGDELPSALERLAPGLITIVPAERVLFVVRGNARRITLLAVDGTLVPVPVRELARCLRERFETPAEVPSFLREFPVAREIYERSRTKLPPTRGKPFFMIAPIRVAAEQPLMTELASQAFGKRLSGSLALMIVESVVAVAATLLLARIAMAGWVDRASILGWGLAMALQTGVTALLALNVGQLNIELSGALKRRLLAGALRLETDSARRDGVGANLALAAESAVVDQLSVLDIAHALSTFVIVALAVAYLTTQDALAAAVLVVFCGLIAALIYDTFRISLQTIRASVKLTDVFVERVLGHQTRLIQLERRDWHQGEDEPLHVYTELAQRMDFRVVALTAAPRVWLFILVLLQLRHLVGAPTMRLDLVPFIAGYAASQALGQFISGGLRLLRWPVSLRLLRRVLEQAVVPRNPDVTQLPEGELDDGDVIVQASGLRYSYGADRPPVLNGLNLEIRSGDRLLVTGPSGGGKSTLASVLTGFRKPTAGLVMLRGIDQPSVRPSVWRRHIVSSPQFHENHIFQNTLAFNLLMGRAWPASAIELQSAEEVCRALELGPLLDRMPAGIHQVVGDTGWRLSHGERSRIFIARAVMQDADLLILDESFGTLDPETLTTAMAAVKRFGRTLMVISHR